MQGCQESKVKELVREVVSFPGVSPSDLGAHNIYTNYSLASCKMEFSNELQLQFHLPFNFFKVILTCYAFDPKPIILLTSVFSKDARLQILAVISYLPI